MCVPRLVTDEFICISEGVTMFLCINFKKNRKRISLFTLLLARIFSLSSPLPFINAKDFSTQLTKIILNGIQEGETVSLDSIKYQCLKNRKNCVFKVTCSTSSQIYIVKLYAYTKSWYADGFVKHLLISPSCLHINIPFPISSGLIDLKTKPYRPFILYHVFPYYNGVTIQQFIKNRTLDEKIALMNEIGTQYKNIEQILNTSLISHIIRLVTPYRFGDNMYDLRDIDYSKIIFLRKRTNKLLRDFNIPTKTIIQNDLYEKNILVDSSTGQINAIIDFEFLSVGNPFVNLYYFMYDFYENKKTSTSLVKAFCSGYGIPLEMLKVSEGVLKQWRVIFQQALIRHHTNDDLTYFFAKN